MVNKKTTKVTKSPKRTKVAVKMKVAPVVTPAATAATPATPVRRLALLLWKARGCLRWPGARARLCSLKCAARRDRQ